MEINNNPSIHLISKIVTYEIEWHKWKIFGGPKFDQCEKFE